MRTGSTISERQTEALDLSTVMKAAEAISGEIQLEKLLARLMEILLENAGAQSGALLLPHGEDWQVAALGAIGDIRILEHSPLQGHENLPLSLIQYSINTRENIVLDNACEQGQFREDPYIRKNTIRSALTFLLLNQGQCDGLVYLENNLTQAAFPPERLEMLRMISAQAAISLENARHYAFNSSMLI